MADVLARGDRVEIRGLCSFYVKKYKDYVGRNPKTGEKVPIKPKKLPFFQSREGTEGEGESVEINWSERNADHETRFTGYQGSNYGSPMRQVK